MDQSLYGDEPAPAPIERAPAPARNWQADLLRKALDARGLESMDERQALVEELAAKSLSSLRDLTEEEALAILSRLGSSTPTTKSKSLWDSRDEDTWIDRL